MGIGIEGNVEKCLHGETTHIPKFPRVRQLERTSSDGCMHGMILET
jgi:hypothetical protein